jgi:hypothetical protein
MILNHEIRVLHESLYTTAAPVRIETSPRCRVGWVEKGFMILTSYEYDSRLSRTYT